MKRIYKISIISGIALILIVGIYFVSRSFLTPKPVPSPEVSGTPLPTAPGNNGSDTTTAPGTDGKTLALKKLSEEEVFDFGVVQASGEIFYLTPTGKVLSAKDGPDLEISGQNVNALNHIELSPRDQKFLVSFGDPKRPQWGIFDLIDKIWRPLPIEITNAAWGVDNDKLIASIKKTNEYNLSEVDLTKSPPTYKIIIRDFRMKDVELSYSGNQKLIIKERPSASYEGRAWQLDLKTGSFNLVVPPERGLIIGWARDGSTAFKFSALSFYTLGLNLASAIKTDFVTLPEKCDAVLEVGFCFVPQNLTLRNVLPDDYFSKEFFSIDALIQFDVISGLSQEILRSGEGNVVALDAKNPKVFRNKIYFINRYDNNLYELDGLPELKVNKDLPL
ncbi:MAG: hypothetical protein AAB617_01070 [Patescibacteria group bacterium]